MSAVGVSHVTPDEGVDSIEIDNDQLAEKAKEGKKKPKKEKIDKRLKVPDFGKFQKILAIGLLSVVALIVLYVFGFVYLPKAKIIIQTKTLTLDSTIPIKLDTNAVVLNTSGEDVPANMQTIQKTVTSNSVNTTGTKQIGLAASGNIVITNPYPSSYGYATSQTIPAGTDFTDPSGNVYVSTVAATLPGWSSCPHGCTQKTDPIPVVASSVGAAYNNSSNNVNFTAGGNVVNNFPSSEIVGGPFTGGTSQTVQVVAQADINSATSQIVAPTKTAIEATLEQQITAAGYTPLPQTFVATPVSYSPSNPAGTQTNTVTVTGTYNYSMYGAHDSDINSLIDSYINGLSTFSPNHQSILDTGLSNATFSIQGSTATTLQGNLTVSSTIGPKLSVSSIKSQSAGKSNSYIISNISSMPGVTSVTIKYSPFWVRAMPHNQSKITVVIEKSNGSAV
jgi:cell division protein FtsL